MLLALRWRRAHYLSVGLRRGAGASVRLLGIEINLIEILTGRQKFGTILERPDKTGNIILNLVEVLVG